METVLRVLFFYLVILLGVRALGKREFSELSPFELVMLLLIPELAQQALIGEDYSATNAVVALCTLFALVFLTSALVQHSRRAEAAIQGEPAVLVYNGRFVRSTLDHERVTADEVYAEMRKSGLERVEQVKWALLESDGEISFIPFRPEDRQVRSRGHPTR